MTSTPKPKVKAIREIPEAYIESLVEQVEAIDDLADNLLAGFVQPEYVNLRMEIARLAGYVTPPTPKKKR